MADNKIPSGIPPANTDVAAQVATDAVVDQAPKPVPMEITPPGEEASQLIKSEKTKTTSGALREPGEASGGEEVEKEEGFIRSALSWLRDNVAKNPWLRGAVAVGSFLFPPLVFLAFIFLALDAILILDKIIAGEKLKLSDIFGFVGELIAATVNAEALLPLSQAGIAGLQLFERWRHERAQGAGEVAAAAAADTATIEKQAADTMRLSEALVERFEAGQEPTRDDATVVGTAFGTMTAAAKREQKIADGEDTKSERIKLKNIMRRLAERIDQLRDLRPAWMDRIIAGEEQPAPA